MRSPSRLEALPSLLYGLMSVMIMLPVGLKPALAVAGVGTGVTFLLLYRAPMRSRLPWLFLLIPPLILPDLFFGTPSIGRLALELFLAPAVLAGLLVAERRGEGGCTHGRERQVMVAICAVFILGSFAAISWRYAIFGDRFISQDTAYFEQMLWGFTEGHNFFMASSQQWWRYNPPLETHFAMHFSPILFLVAAWYWLIPHAGALHFLQISGIVLSVLPLYFWLERWDARAALMMSVAYLMNPAVLSQTQLAFHALALAAPLVSAAACFFLTDRLRPYLLCLVGALLVREDLALVALLGGLAGLFKPFALRQRLAWVAWPLLIGSSGWLVASWVMTCFGNSGTQVITSLFERFGSTPREILWGMLTQPGLVLDQLLEEHRKRYLLGLFRPGLLGALAHPLGLLALPTIAINLLVRGAGTAWLDQHYSVYLPALLTPASIAFFLKRDAVISRFFRVSPLLVWRALGMLMIASSLLSLPEVVNSRTLSYYRIPPDLDDIHDVLNAIPDEVPLAVPRYLAHAVARREQLYLVNRVQQYHRFEPQYVVVETGMRDPGLADGTLEDYLRFAQSLATDKRFEVVVSRPHLILYRRRVTEAPRGEK